MTVYHIGKDSTPKVCKALKGTCPLGGEHFTSLPEARTFSELKLAQEYGDSAEKRLEDIFTVSQRRRMWNENPKMSYVHPLGTVLISKRGDLWELTDREQVGGQLDHLFTLTNRRSGKKVVVNTDYNRKPGERAPEDFAQLKPHSFKVDGPPLREGTGLEELPNGKVTIDDAMIAKVRVHTVENELDKSLPKGYDEYGDRSKEEERRIYGRSLEKPLYRYMVVPNTTKAEVQDPAKRELLARALWAHAGRDQQSWESLTPQEKSNLFMDSKAVKKATFYTKNGSTSYVNEDLRENQFDSFWLPGSTPTSSISLFRDNG